MRFQVEHRFDAPSAAVAALIADPDFYLELSLPDLSRPELQGQQTDGTTTSLRLRYEFVGSLDPIAQRLIGAGRLAWIQDVRIDRSTGSGTLRFAAEKEPRRLHGSADFSLTGTDDTTVRRITGELVVAVPGLGRMAERRIVPGLVHRLDIEADALTARLR